MVAAHSAHLKADGGFGLHTGFIYRPNEFGSGGKTEKINPCEFDVVSSDRINLAKKMGA
jgi:hypothetical protein